MAINRRLAIYIAVATALAITGLAFLSWMNPLTVGPIGIVDLRITDAQFDNGYLNVTVKNVGCSGTVISGVTVNQTSTPYTFPVHEQIWANEEISVCIDFKWTSGYAYQIKLETEDKENWDHLDTTVAVAP
jgi:hypothetical protein